MSVISANFLKPIHFFQELKNGEKNQNRLFSETGFWTPFFQVFEVFEVLGIWTWLCVRFWWFCQFWSGPVQKWSKNGPKMAIFSDFWGSRNPKKRDFAWFWWFFTFFQRSAKIPVFDHFLEGFWKGFGRFWNVWKLNAYL